MSNANLHEMPPGPDLDLLYAKAVGLPIIIHGTIVENDDPYVFVCRDGALQIRSANSFDWKWSPSVDLGQAVAWADKFARKHEYSYRLEYFRGDHSNPYGFVMGIFNGMGRTPALAVVRCVCEVADSEGLLC